MDYRDYIEVNAEIMLGKPILKGTRITVEGIVRKLGEGATTADIISMYPKLTDKHIQSCLLYASDLISNDELIVA